MPSAGIEPSEVIIRVRDDCLGIAAADLPRRSPEADEFENDDYDDYEADNVKNAVVHKLIDVPATYVAALRIARIPFQKTRVLIHPG